MTFPEWLSRMEPLPHTRGRASVLVFVVFCVHMYSFAGLIRRTPLPTFSNTAVTDRHSDTAIFQLAGCGYPGLLDRKNCWDMCPRWESNSRLPACKSSTISTRPGSPLFLFECIIISKNIKAKQKCNFSTFPIQKAEGQNLTLS